MLIRRETDPDVEVIDTIHRAAFAGQTPAGEEPVEVGLVRSLRADAGWIPALSLVAEDAAGAVVGHVVCTRAFVRDDGHRASRAIARRAPAASPAHRGV